MKAFERKLQANVEKEEDDAQFGDGVDVDVLGHEGNVEGNHFVDPAHNMRSDQHARDEKAEHRADAQTAEQRHDNARHQQEEQRRLVRLEIEMRGQLLSPTKTG